MGLGEIRLDGQRLVMAGDGILQPPQFLERATQVVMDLGEVRLDGEGTQVAGDGILQGA